MKGARQSAADRDAALSKSTSYRETFHRHAFNATCIVVLLLLFSPRLGGQNNTVDVQEIARSAEQPHATSQQSSNTKRSKHDDKYDVARIGSRGIGQGINLYSVERERELGRELAAETDAEVQLLPDTIVVDYINRIAQNLVRHSDATVPFTVKVIDSDEVNAFTLPGGYLYVNTGLLLAAENEAEFAGVMAHEIAHVAARHATKTLTRRQIFSLATVPLLFVGGGAAMAIGQAAGLAQPISFFKFSRNAEREADLLGLEYAYAAGYDPAEFVRFFERMRKISGEKKNAWFVTKLFAMHPMTSDRIRRAQHEIATMLPSRDRYVVTTSDFDDIRTRVVRLHTSQYSNTPESFTPTLRRRTPEHPQQEERR